MSKTKVVKMSEMKGDIAASVFVLLNPKKVSLKKVGSHLVIVTDTEPAELIYPEGWYYAKGSFRNKHTSTTGMYYEILMEKSNGTEWADEATYCTLAPII